MAIFTDKTAIYSAIVPKMNQKKNLGYIWTNSPFNIFVKFKYYTFVVY